MGLSKTQICSGPLCAKQQRYEGQFLIYYLYTNNSIPMVHVVLSESNSNMSALQQMHGTTW